MDSKELFKDAQILLMQGKHADAVEGFTRALEAGAKPFMAYLSRGAAFMKLEKPAMAVEDFTRAIEIEPDNPRAHYFRGVAHMLGESYENAVSDLSRAIELKPDHGAAFFARGTCNAQIGRDEEAARDLKTAISYSEAAVQGFVDTFGVLRTQFDGVMALLSSERRPAGMTLTDEEADKIKKLLEE